MEHFNHFLHGIIPIVYLMIAVQFFLEFYKSKKNQGAQRALAYMVIIFIMCSFCGYVFDFLHPPPLIKAVAHLVLITASISFIITNQASIVVNAIKDRVSG